MRSQNTIYSAEQEAIIKAIGTTRKSNKKRVILTDSLSTMMATERNGDTKNPKTRILRKMIDEEGAKVSLVWVPGHKGITGNEMADIEAKTALDDVIYPTEPYGSPPKLLNHEISNERRVTKKLKKEQANKNRPKTQKGWEERTKSLSPG
jgi:ribonuclease HI